MISRGAFRLDIGSLVLDGVEPAGRNGCAQAFTVAATALSAGATSRARS